MPLLLNALQGDERADLIHKKVSSAEWERHHQAHTLV